jgi:hypothetical protein
MMIRRRINYGALIKRDRVHTRSVAFPKRSESPALVPRVLQYHHDQLRLIPKHFV